MKISANLTKVVNVEHDGFGVYLSVKIEHPKAGGVVTVDGERDELFEYPKVLILDSGWKRLACIIGGLGRNNKMSLSTGGKV
jgi:hypothetical protein